MRNMIRIPGVLFLYQISPLKRTYPWVPWRSVMYEPWEENPSTQLWIYEVSCNPGTCIKMSNPTTSPPSIVHTNWKDKKMCWKLYLWYKQKISDHYLAIQTHSIFSCCGKTIKATRLTKNIHGEKFSTIIVSSNLLFSRPRRITCETSNLIGDEFGGANTIYGLFFLVGWDHRRIPLCWPRSGSQIYFYSSSIWSPIL